MPKSLANSVISTARGNLILAGGDSSGDIVVCHQGISFWGGFDPDTSRIIDAHHPDHGASLVGRVVMIS